jgi:hypothetical protein
MVCDKCEAKLSKLVVPDKWAAGASGKDGGRPRAGASGPASGKAPAKRSRASRCVAFRSCRGSWTARRRLF